MCQLRNRKKYDCGAIAHGKDIVNVLIKKYLLLKSCQNTNENRMSYTTAQYIIETVKIICFKEKSAELFDKPNYHLQRSWWTVNTSS